MDKNLEVYNSKQVVDWYTQLKEIIPVEKAIFEKFKTFIKQADFLDIGIGGGRTTAYLYKLCKTYTGIDYSESFVKTAKQNHPSATCLTMDARNLSAFTDKRFDFVNFSFNGIDYTNVEGRKKIFSEIARVLKPNGIFFFSTHNKSHSTFNLHPWLNKNNSLYANLKTLLKISPFLFKKILRKKDEVFNDQFAIINDSAHNYSLMTFYTTPEFLRTQLTEINFGEINFYTKSGDIKEEGQLDDWIFVTAKKISA